jgi:hypothetical protein
MEPKKLLTQNQLAVALNVCQETVSRLTVNKRIPFICVGRRGKRYDLDAVIAALASATSINETTRGNTAKKLS